MSASPAKMPNQEATRPTCPKSHEPAFGNQVVSQPVAVSSLSLPKISVREGPFVDEFFTTTALVAAYSLTRLVSIATAGGTFVLDSALWKNFLISLGGCVAQYSIRSSTR